MQYQQLKAILDFTCGVKDSEALANEKDRRRDYEADFQTRMRGGDFTRMCVVMWDAADDAKVTLDVSIDEISTSRDPYDLGRTIGNSLIQSIQGADYEQ